MKKLLLVLLVPFMALLSGCSALTKFYINYAQDFTLNPGLPIATPLNFTTPQFPTNTAYVFEANNTNKDLLEGCKLVQLYTEIIDPASEDFSFLNSARLYLSAPSLPEVEIAFNDAIPNDVGATLQFDETEAELIEYIKQDYLILRLATTNDEVTTQEIKVRAHLRFFVDAKILGM